MGLTKITNARIEKTGFWVFSVWRLYVTKRQFFALRRRQFMAISSADGPVPVVKDGTRLLWKVGNDFYWDSEGITAEAVELLLWDRARRFDAKINRLQKIRLRAEDVEASRRERIPDEVRAFVWERDQGQCVKCGSEDNLQFDHIIPVAKGGGFGVENIQLLCGDCNLMKSDSIV